MCSKILVLYQSLINLVKQWYLPQRRMVNKWYLQAKQNMISYKKIFNISLFHLQINIGKSVEVW